MHENEPVVVLAAVSRICGDVDDSGHAVRDVGVNLRAWESNTVDDRFGPPLTGGWGRECSTPSSNPESGTDQGRQTPPRVGATA